MKIAISICLILAGFAIGWLLNAPADEVDVLPNDQPDLIELSSNASPEWKAKVQGQSTAAVVTAIYEDSMDAGYEDKFDLFKSLMEKEHSTSRELHARMLLLSMDEEELGLAIEQARFEEADRRTMDLLYSRLVDLDRDAAWAYYLQQPDPDEVSILSYYIFKRWVLEDEAGAMAAWAQLDEHTQGTRLQTMVKSLLEVDINAALQLQRNYGKMGSRDSYSYRDIIRKWAQQDLASAKVALGLVPRGVHERAYSVYFDELINEDRELAMTEAKALSGLADRKRALSQVYRNWIEEDVDAALAALAHEKTPEDYFSHWQLARDEPEKLMTWAFENMKGAEQDYMISSSMRAMVDRENGLEMAMGYLDALPYGDAYERSLSALASEWSESDPEAAIAWARQLGDEYDQSRALGSIMWRYADDNPQAAQQLYLSLDEKQREAVDDNLIRKLTERDPQRTLAWVDSLPDSANPDQLRMETYERWAREDATGLMDHLGQDGFRQLDEGARRNLLGEWAEYSPREASAWLGEIPADDYDEDQMVKMHQAVARNWLRYDTYEASEWIASLPAGKARDSSVYDLVNSVRQQDPAAALEWLPEVAEGSQFSMADRLFRDWKDKDAAYAALVSSHLNDEQVNKLAEKYFSDRQ